MSDVFISYSRNDKDFARRLHGALTAQKRDTWVDWEDIVPTADWWETTKTGIKQADTVIFIISPESLESAVCHLEINYALQHKKRIIPCIWQEVDAGAAFGNLARKKLDDLTLARLAGRNVLTIATDNWQVLASHNWIFFKDEAAFDTTFEKLIGTIGTDYVPVREPKPPAAPPILEHPRQDDEKALEGEPADEPGTGLSGGLDDDIAEAEASDLDLEDLDQFGEEAEETPATEPDWLKAEAPEPKPPAAPAPAASPAAPEEPTAKRARRRESAITKEESPVVVGSAAKPPDEVVKEVQAVQFSAYYPREIRPNEWQPLQAYIYQQFAADKIAEDATKQLGPLDTFRRIVERARQNIPEGEIISATPHLPGFQFNPPTVTIGFYEDWHRLSFKMRAKDAPLNLAANGFLTFTANGVIVADIPLSVFVTSQVTHNKPQASEPQPVYDTIFASYSHDDSHIVERVEAAASALGLTYLRDVITLRSGEDWNDRLLEMIEQATIFQLFWSAEAAQSAYCKQEWEYALGLKRRGASFIRPVYWSQPMPDPPPELGHLHFAYQPDLVS